MVTTGHKKGINMKISNTDKVAVLAQALPYIQNYYGKIIVVKYGGNAMIDENLKQAVMSDIVLLNLVGIKVVLVHGGGPEINQVLQAMGKESKFINGLRYTDKETAEIVQMVLCGKVNKSLVSLIGQNKGMALGLSGMDSNLIKAEKLDSEIDLGYVGEIVSVNTSPILDALEKGYIPVIATVGTGDNGEVYNINADTAAARIASELGAENLVLMTDIRGLLQDKDDEDTLISNVSVSEVAHLKKAGIISGGMIPKIDCCVESVRRGVKKAVIIDGRVLHSILLEILSDEGIGTMFS